MVPLMPVCCGTVQRKLYVPAVLKSQVAVHGAPSTIVGQAGEHTGDAGGFVKLRLCPLIPDG
jgi:hypothetical protein